MQTYVLGKQYGNQTLFVCAGVSFDYDAGRAVRFTSVHDAVDFRNQMPHQLGGNQQYHVHELHPDGTLNDMEP